MDNSTINPARPLQAGLIRRALTRDDLAALVDLATECHLADGGLAFMNEPDNLASRYFPDAPGASIGAFAASEQLVACAMVHLARQSDTERAIIVGQVRPKLRNRGIGAFLMRWSQAEAQTLFTATPLDKRLLQVATESLTESANLPWLTNSFKPTTPRSASGQDSQAGPPLSGLTIGLPTTSDPSGRCWRARVMYRRAS
jgi:hypothetical protein